jgi:hypothetical protein
VAPQPPKPGVKVPTSVPLDARAREELERQERHRTEELLDQCETLEEDLEKLKGRFELYFLGIDRREPARDREEMKRRVARLKGEYTRNTGLRFRVETLHARFLSYERMWMRSARQKEDGTYRRDLMKARRRAELEAKRQQGEGRKDATPASPSGAGQEAGEQEAVSAAPAPVRPEPSAPARVDPSAARPEESPIPPGTARAEAAAPAPLAAGKRAAQLPSGMSEAQLRALHSAYVEAKRRCHEDVSRVSYEALANTLAKQVPELMARYKASTIEFKVVIKDGRVILKAVPRF